MTISDVLKGAARTIFPTTAAVANIYGDRGFRGLGRSVLKQIFPTTYSLYKRVSMAPVSEAADELSYNTMLNNNTLLSSVDRLDQQNYILSQILFEVKNGGVGKRGGTPFARTPKEAAILNEKEKAARAKAGTGRLSSVTIKGVGIVFAAKAAYDLWQQIMSLDPNDPDWTEKCTTYVVQLIGQLGLALAGGFIGAMIGAPLGAGAIVTMLLGLMAGAVLQEFLGDATDKEIQELVHKIFDHVKKKKPTKPEDKNASDALVPQTADDFQKYVEDQDKKLELDSITYKANLLTFRAKDMSIIAKKIIDGSDDGAKTGGSTGSQSSLTTPTNTEGAGNVTPSGNLTSIKTSNKGLTTQVDKAYAPNFQRFIDGIEQLPDPKTGKNYVINDLGGFANRANVNNPSVKSFHAMGAAIDINPSSNKNMTRKTDMPEGTAQLAAASGLGWGINFSTTPDPMHFSAAKEEHGAFDIHRGTLQRYLSGTSYVPVTGPAVVDDNEMIVHNGSITYARTPAEGKIMNLSMGDQVIPESATALVEKNFELINNVIQQMSIISTSTEEVESPQTYIINQPSSRSTTRISQSKKESNDETHHVHIYQSTQLLGMMLNAK